MLSRREARLRFHPAPGTAGYSAGLPGFETYLREKYGMSDAAVAEAEAFFHDLQQRDTGGRRGKRRR